jgi:hypothetical protein
VPSFTRGWGLGRCPSSADRLSSIKDYTGHDKYPSEPVNAAYALYRTALQTVQQYAGARNNLASKRLTGVPVGFDTLGIVDDDLPESDADFVPRGSRQRLTKALAELGV